MVSTVETFIDNNIFLQIEKSDAKTLFLYIIIIVLILAVFQYLSIGVNIILGIFFAILLILYLNSKNQFQEKNLKEIYDNKVNLIRPKPKHLQRYPKFVDFVFAIQDFYSYNVPAYENMIDFIDYVIELYEESINDNSTAGFNYGLVDNARKESVNNLHSIIFDIPSNNIIINKLNDSIDKLNELIYDILDELYSLHKLYIFNNGYNRNTVSIIKGPKPENFYNEENNFDIF